MVTERFPFFQLIISIRILLFLFHSFAIETTNTFMRLRIPLKRTRESQSVYLWSDQNGAKTIPFWAAHTYQANIREYHQCVKTYISLLL